MFKNAIVLFAILFLAFSSYGCVAVVAGAVGGAGTSAWLSGKLSQEVNASFDSSIKAAKRAMDALRLEVTKETTEDDIAQIIGKYSDGRKTWIDVRRVSRSVSRVDVRVGIKGDQEASREILNKIIRYAR